MEKQETFDKKRIVKNSVTLYIRMMFTMILNLLTTRFVLAALGVEDMGVYGVVGSVVSMFTVFVSGLLAAIQRFITYEIGKPNGDVGKVFATSATLIMLLSLVLLILMEFGGILMLECNLNIPIHSITAAHWVLQFSIFTSLLNLNTTPYSAVLIAHERMNLWAMLSVLQVVLSCTSAYFLDHFDAGERLILYAFCCFVVQLVIWVFYVVCCARSFNECHFCLYVDKSKVREMAKFAGASTTSSILQMITNQGLVLVINWTFGVAVNAVYNIGLQVKNAVLSFGLNVFKSVSPQITKTYARGEIELHKKLVYTGSKMGTYMIMFILIPFCLHSHCILGVWLGNVPQYTSEFSVVLVFQSLVYAGFEPYRTAILATGNVIRFYIYSELVHTLSLPIAYIAGISSETPMLLLVSVVLMEFVYCATMVTLGSKVSPIKKMGLLKHVLLPCTVVFAITLLIVGLLDKLLPSGWVGLLVQLTVGNLLLILVIYVIGLDGYEKELIKKMICKIKERIWIS